MAILTEISWDDMFSGKSLPESLARKAFREAVEVVAEKARTAVPELNGRVERAVQIILNGDLSIAPDGQGKIASQSNGHIEYLVGKGDTCSCKDHPKAPKRLCKHLLAYHIYKRATALAKEQLKALDHPPSKTEPITPPVEPPVTEPVKPVIPSAEPLVQSEPAVSQVSL